MPLLEQIDVAMAGRSYEVIIVDDNSTAHDTCAVLPSCALISVEATGA